MKNIQISFSFIIISMPFNILIQVSLNHYNLAIYNLITEFQNPSILIK